MEKILRLPEVLSTSGLSRSTISTMIGKGQFPKPIKLSTRTSGWRLSEIEQWIRDRAGAGR